MSIVWLFGYSGVKWTRHRPPPSTWTWFGTAPSLMAISSWPSPACDASTLRGIRLLNFGFLTSKTSFISCCNALLKLPELVAQKSFSSPRPTRIAQSRKNLFAGLGIPELTGTGMVDQLCHYVSRTRGWVKNRKLWKKGETPGSCGPTHICPLQKFPLPWVWSRSRRGHHPRKHWEDTTLIKVSLCTDQKPETGAKKSRKKGQITRRHRIAEKLWKAQQVENGLIFWYTAHLYGQCTVQGKLVLQACWPYKQWRQYSGVRCHIYKCLALWSIFSRSQSDMSASGLTVTSHLIQDSWVSLWTSSG